MLLRKRIHRLSSSATALVAVRRRDRIGTLSWAGKSDILLRNAAGVATGTMSRTAAVPYLSCNCRLIRAAQAYHLIAITIAAPVVPAGMRWRLTSSLAQTPSTCRRCLDRPGAGGWPDGQFTTLSKRLTAGLSKHRCAPRLTIDMR
jgi:hypothetical protein